MDCSLPGSPVHGIFPARVLEWVAISFSTGSPQPKNHTHVSFWQVGPLPLSHQGSSRIIVLLPHLAGWLVVWDY